MVAQLSLPTVTATDDIVTITSEALVAASYHWVKLGDVPLGMFLMYLSDPVKLAIVPIRLDRALAESLVLA